MINAYMIIISILLNVFKKLNTDILYNQLFNEYAKLENLNSKLSNTNLSLKKIEYTKKIV